MITSCLPLPPSVTSKSMAVSSLISKTVLQHVLKPSICRSIATLPKAHLPPASAWLSWVTKNKSKLCKLNRWHSYPFFLGGVCFPNRTDDVGWNILDENTAGSWWDVCKGEDGKMVTKPHIYIVSRVLTERIVSITFKCGSLFYSDT